jgi:hypothetical protein
MHAAPTKTVLALNRSTSLRRCCPQTGAGTMQQAAAPAYLAELHGNVLEALLLPALLVQNNVGVLQAAQHTHLIARLQHSLRARAEGRRREQPAGSGRVVSLGGAGWQNPAASLLGPSASC